NHVGLFLCTHGPDSAVTTPRHFEHRREPDPRVGTGRQHGLVAPVAHADLLPGSRASAEGGQHLRRELVEAVDVERRPHGEDDPFGAGVRVLADAVDDLLHTAHEHTGLHELGDVAELDLEVT